MLLYNGMNGAQQTWLVYGYIFYLVGIMIVIVVLCRNFLLFTRLFGKNIVKVMATLLFLLYSPLTHAIIRSFHCTEVLVSTPNGTQRRNVWQYDGNLLCYGKQHLPLFITGVVCTILIVGFAVSLLLVQCLQRRTNYLCLRWVEKTRPFYKAYTGPCHDNYRFWPGFLLLMRMGMYTLNSDFSLSPPTRTLAYIITAALCALILSLSCIFPRGVYKKWLLNMLEFSFFLDLLITSALLSDSNLNSYHIIYTSVTIAMMMSVVIVTYHTVLNIRSTIQHHFNIQTRLHDLADKLLCKCKSEK